MSGEFFPQVNCPHQIAPWLIAPGRSPLSGEARNLTEGQLGCSQHYFICFLLAMIFEGAIVHSNIHGRQIGGNLLGGNSPGGNLPGGDLMGGNSPRGKLPGGNSPYTNIQMKQKSYNNEDFAKKNKP